jgi:hypothetical protein
MLERNKNDEIVENLLTNVVGLYYYYTKNKVHRQNLSKL